MFCGGGAVLIKILPSFFSLCSSAFIITGMNSRGESPAINELCAETFDALFLLIDVVARKSAPATVANLKFSSCFHSGYIKLRVTD